MSKKIFIFTLGCIFIAVFIGIFRFSKFHPFLGLFPPSVKKVEQIYYECTEELSYIGKELIDNQFTKIRIDIFDSIEEIEYSFPNGKGGYEIQNRKIADTNFINALTVLKNEGFIRILKENNYVYFQIWGSFGGSIGLIYSEDQEPDVSRINAEIKVIEKLKPENWYYYKEMDE